MEHGPALSSMALLALGCIVLLGYYAGRGARRARLPSLIGYMLLGVALGPSGEGLLDGALSESLAFITQIALGFVAFSIGSELSLTELRRLGGGILAIILSESLTAFFLVLAAVYLWTGDLPLALVFAAVAPASAPAGTVAVIQETKAKGSLTKALYAVVGFDDGLAIVLFGFAAALAKTLLLHEVDPQSSTHLLAAMWPPLREIVLSLVVGGVAGVAFCNLVRRIENPREMLIVVTGTVFLVTGLATICHLSLILSNMMVGFVLVNTRREALTERVGEQLLAVMPLLFILFFTLAGAHLRLGALPALGALGIVYILGRTGGLILGARIGGSLGRVEEKIKRWIGLGILSQAGVAIGLSLIVAQDFASIPGEHAGRIAASLLTTVTATCIFFEVIGPILTKVALERAGEIPPPSPASESRRAQGRAER